MRSQLADRLTDRGRGWLTPGLLALTVGIYALVITGAVTSLADASAACSSWPTCTGTPTDAFADRDLAIAIVHRIVTLVTFGLLLGTTAIAWLTDAPRGVRYTIVGVLVVFPIQMGIGALTVSTGGSELLSAIHLLLAMAIFAGGLVALLYWLEWDTRQVESTFVDVDDAEEVRRPVHGTDVDRHPSRLRAYFTMTKPRLMWLLSIVALAGIGLAAATTGVVVPASVIGGTLLGGVLAIGASGTFNHVLERDIDRQMARTADRPMPQSAVPARNAVIFGGLLAFASIATFLVFTNALAAGLGLVAIAFYSVVYTLVLKPNTTQNIVIGGAVGAFPAIIGWAAVTGSIGLPAVILGLVIFLWTPAHFYNLALVYQRDYERGGFPMLPLVRGELVTRRHIVLYAGATLVSLGVLGATADLGLIYGATAILAGGGFLVTIVHLYESQTPTAAMRAFHASNAFLGVIMLVIILETIIL